MAALYFNIGTVSRWLGATALLLVAASATPFTTAAPSATAEVIATEPVGYISTIATGGVAGAPSHTFVSPSLANPVLWQGQVTAVSGTTLSVNKADWEAGHFDSRHLLEIVTGAYAGIWAPVVSTNGSQLVLAESLQSVLSAGDTVRIRRFTTLSDFLGAANEAGLRAGNELADADAVVIYHATGPRSYWYYNGSQSIAAGWYNSSWRPAANTVIAPGEGVVVQRRGLSDLPLHQSGNIKAGKQGIIIEPGRNFVGAVIAADLPLGSSQLYTGSAQSGLASGRELAAADTIVIYGERPRSYWYYEGSQGLPAGWYDSSWRAAANVMIPAGSTVVIERRQPEPFVWYVPSFAP